MLLTQLLDFEWLNEPKDVNFSEDGLRATAQNGTDFWQNARRGVRKDDGHFFFARKSGNFVMEVKWSFREIKNFEQCGAMLRIDERNWFKISIMTDNPSSPKLGSCVVNNGCMDWVVQDIPAGISEIWFRVKRQNGDYIIFYSLDGKIFRQIRLFSFLNEDVEIKAGAYLANPKDGEFEAVLNKIDFE